MSWERKELLVWNKNLFSSFLKGYHWSNFFGRWESHFKHHATLIKILLITYYRMELAPDFLMRARLSYLLIIKIFRDVNGRHIATNAGWYRLRVSISAVCGGACIEGIQASICVNCFLHDYVLFYVPLLNFSLYLCSMALSWGGGSFLFGCVFWYGRVGVWCVALHGGGVGWWWAGPGDFDMYFCGGFARCCRIRFL